MDILHEAHWYENISGSGVQPFITEDQTQKTEGQSHSEAQEYHLSSCIFKLANYARGIIKQCVGLSWPEGHSLDTLDLRIMRKKTCCLV